MLSELWEKGLTDGGVGRSSLCSISIRYTTVLLRIWAQNSGYNRKLIPAVKAAPEDIDYRYSLLFRRIQVAYQADWEEPPKQTLQTIGTEPTHHRSQVDLHTYEMTVWLIQYRRQLVKWSLRYVWLTKVMARVLMNWLNFLTLHSPYGQLLSARKYFFFLDTWTAATSRFSGPRYRSAYVAPPNVCSGVTVWRTLCDDTCLLSDNGYGAFLWTYCLTEVTSWKREYVQWIRDGYVPFSCQSI
jgi:hypothetical protein